MRHRRPRTRIGSYMRARLRRRIFVWFGLTIVLTFAAIFGTMHLFGGSNEWRRELERARALMSHSFERVWDVPADRDALARMIARDLDADITVRDGPSVLVVGRACEKPVLTAKVRTGTVAVCPASTRQRASGRLILALVCAGAILWAVSGRIARRLAQPFDQLAALAGDLGRGNLGARMQVPKWRHDDVAILGRALNDMAERIEKMVADQRELLAAVSHEIRTPLSRVRILTELGRDGLSEGRTAAQTFDEIDREVVEIDSLVSELLASARLDFAAAKPIELDAADSARRALERSSVDVSKLEAQTARVKADPTLLLRALANLIDNANRHGGGLEQLRVEADDATVRFEALDRGPGLKPGDDIKIFESFYRNGDDDKPSLGLGLALVRRIADAHGGRAYARNRDGGGAVVGLELPRA